MRCKAVGRSIQSGVVLAGLLSWPTAVAGSGGGDPDPAPPVPSRIRFENEVLRYEIGTNGQNLHFIDKRTGQDYCARNPASPVARLKRGGQEFSASAASLDQGRLTVGFGAAHVGVVLKVAPARHYLTMEVVSVSDPEVQELTFADVALTLRGTPDEAFAACALALNLQAKVREVPRATSRLQAMCYPRFGFAGAKVALIGCPQARLRQVMQEVVSAAPDLPHSPIGGPWALDAEINQGSYLFNFGNLSTATAEEWVRLARDLGLNQIDFHGGSSFRFGDCLPNPQTYPEGRASLRAVIDRLHAAGLQAGLHTYAFFIDKRCPWVTPKPDPRLAKDATFSLAEVLSADSQTVPVRESTKQMSAVTGFFVRNSATLQIDDELITYSGVAREAPCGFTGCRRGAYGTQAATHAPGAKVHHLKECFGLFVPDGDSSLLSEVAARTAEMFNECGFDMMYLDALDGEDILGGAENGWHYGSKFVFELWRRLARPALMEMSTFHHHLWYVRSRLGAWDHPTRSHKKFIDIHCAANDEARPLFLPMHLGWWAIKTWTGPQGEPTFADDLEYLCGKALGAGAGLSLMGVDPAGFRKNPALQRLGAITRQYEALRHRRYFPEAIKQQLRVPGREFTLTQSGPDQWQLRPAVYHKHKVEGLEGGAATWSTTNRFDPQPLQLRLELLMAAAPYDSTGRVVLTDFQHPMEFTERASAAGVTPDLVPSSAQTKAGALSGWFTATNTLAERRGAWAKRGKRFSPPLNLGGERALGVWVHGDGQGEVLNLQLHSPAHVVGGLGEHYITVDFTGWKYFELIEPEGERYADYAWPYGSPYEIYRESVDYRQIEQLNLWYNHLPPGRAAGCYLGPVQALPLVKAKCRHPTFSIAGKSVTFPIEMEAGAYLEFKPPADGKLYGPDGALLAEVAVRGDVPTVPTGESQVTFGCETDGPYRLRARVTLITTGPPLPN
jgi:hypothetical protein